MKNPDIPKSLLAISIAIGIWIPQPASAVNFNIGDIEGQFDSNLSMGASWATQSPKAHLMLNTSVDDGKRNFEKGKTFSKVFKGIHDLELKYQDSGLFARAKYWYDFELKDEGRAFKDISDHNRKEGAKSSGAQLLDAFLYHNYQIGEMPGSVRLGKQVVSWGESTFIQGGINTINPVDVAAFRRPGSEIKEGLIPVNMFYMSQSFSDEVSAEAFYQLEWDQTVLDNCGTFFSQGDMMADGCDSLTLGPALDTNAAAQAALSPFGVQLTSEGIALPRAGDRDARDQGQWGAAIRWFSTELNSEFAGYFINYHSRQPYLSSITGPNTVDLGFAPQLCNNIGIPALGCAGFMSSEAGQSLVQAYRLGTSKYFAEYPEDIRLYGLSISTSLPTGTTLAGEISYRPNLPVQIAPSDIILANLGIAQVTPLLSSGELTVGNGTELHGYKRKEVTQAQLTATHFFDQVMLADRLTMIGEVGVTHIGGLEGKGGVRYGRSAFGQGELYPDNTLCRTLTNSAAPQECDSDGFATSTSWGYRVRAIWEYSGLIPGIQLNPNLAWSHDVNGYGPEPGFNEGSKAISVGIDASYLSTYNASLSYTNFFGGSYNASEDRDFIALSFGMAF